MEHNFNIKVAEKYGVHSAIILNNLYFWIEKNKANNMHFYDGEYWTYNSKRAFSELFPYMTERQIDYAIKKLIDGGLIKKGNYNKSGYDRTLWYSITKVGYCILQNCKMEETKLSNGFYEIVKPIPDINSDINTYININKEKIYKKEIGQSLDNVQHIYRFKKPTVEEIKEYCLERKNKVDAERFYDFYESKGWKVGKNSMKDWKASVRTWERANNYISYNKKEISQKIQTREYDKNKLTELFDDLDEVVI